MQTLATMSDTLGRTGAGGSRLQQPYHESVWRRSLHCWHCIGLFFCYPHPQQWIRMGHPPLKVPVYFILFYYYLYFEPFQRELLLLLFFLPSCCVYALSSLALTFLSKCASVCSFSVCMCVLCMYVCLCDGCLHLQWALFRLGPEVDLR